MKKYDVHEDFKNLNARLPMKAGLLPLFGRMIRMLYERQGVLEGIEHNIVKIRGYEGYELPVEVFSPMAIDDRAPCVMYMHGGAFALPATDFHKKLMCDYASKVPCKVVFVDYRLAPKYPFPYALEDCYAAYEWIRANAAEQGFDIDKLGLCGDSAGGALAASLAQVIRDRKAKIPLFQMLIYPVTDSRMESESMKLFVDTPVWNQKKNETMWKIYMPKTASLKEMEYASPMAARSLKDLPQAYIEVSEFDCLRDEGIGYYEALKKAGINAVINRTKGTIHGFELNYTSAYTQSIIAKRIKYMSEKFSLS
jgi:acetyl esterase/lipase